MITRIQFSVKQGNQIVLTAFPKSNRARCIEHAINTAKAIGWSLEPKVNTEFRVVAAAPREPAVNQFISLFMMRGAKPTYFEYVVKDPGQTTALSVTLTVFVTQPTPGKENRFLEILNIVGKQLAYEFARDHTSMKWHRSDCASFQKAIEHAAKRGLKGNELIEAAEQHRSEFTFDLQL